MESLHGQPAIENGGFFTFNEWFFVKQFRKITTKGASYPFIVFNPIFREMVFLSRMVQKKHLPRRLTCLVLLLFFV